MLHKAIEAAGINNLKEDRFYLALIQDGHVRVTSLSITLHALILFSEKAGFPDNLRGPKPGYNIPRVACCTA